MALPVSALEWFNYYYPAFADCNDPRHADSVTIQMALDIAALKVPNCELASDRDKMQSAAHWAAHELSKRYANKRNNGLANDKELVIIREKLGNKEYQYQTPSATPVTIQGNVTPYEAWLELDKICPKYNGFSLRTRRI